MAREWPEVKLGEIVELTTGFPFQSQRYTSEDAAPRLLRGDNIAQGTLRWDGVKRWPPDEADGLNQYWLKSNDVVLAMDRPWIEAGLKYASIRGSDLPCLLVQRVARIRGSDRLDGGFLKFLIASQEFTNHVLAVQTGTAVPHISAGQIREFTFRLPPIDEQRAIAQRLDSLDDKIELNRKMNETLEAMARALFKSWFVDFDPVRAKAEGRAPGLPPHIADLFPDSFEESELGEIPKGWSIGQVDSLCESITSGGTPKRKEPSFWMGGTIPWFKTGELLDGPLIDSEECITEAALRDSSCKLWPAGTVLFALYASPTVGRIGILTRPGTSNQAAAGLLVKAEHGVPFLRRTLVAARSKLQSIAVGAAQQNINQAVLKRHRTVIPPSSLTSLYSSLVDPFDNRQIALAKECGLLVNLRDTLLPNLISGVVRTNSNHIANSESPI